LPNPRRQRAAVNPLVCHRLGEVTSDGGKSKSEMGPSMHHFILEQMS